MEFLPGVLQVLLVEIGPAQVCARENRRIVGWILQGVESAFDGLIPVLHEQRNRRNAVPRFREVGPNLDRLAEATFGFLQLLALLGPHGLGVGAPEARIGLGLSAVVVGLLECDEPEQVVSFGVLGIGLDGLLQLLDSGLAPAVFEVPDGKLIAHLGLIGIPLGTRSAPGSR